MLHVYIQTCEHFAHHKMAAEETIHAVLLRGRWGAGSWMPCLTAHCFVNPETRWFGEDVQLPKYTYVFLGLIRYTNSQPMEWIICFNPIYNQLWLTKDHNCRVWQVILTYNGWNVEWYLTFIDTIYNSKYNAIWRFPKIGVPPNHPFQCDFLHKPSSYWVLPWLWKPIVIHYMNLNWWNRHLLTPRIQL